MLAGEFLWFTFESQYDAMNTILRFPQQVLSAVFLRAALWLLVSIARFKIGGDGIPEEYYKNSLDAHTKRNFYTVNCRAVMGAFIMSMGSLIDQIIIQRVLKELAVTNPGTY